MNKGCYLAIDLGATKILSAVFTSKLALMGRVKTLTKASGGTDAVLERVFESAELSMKKAGIKLSDVVAVAIGVPGTVDPRTGNVIIAPNLEWHQYPIKEVLEAKFELPVFVENDGNLATLGIYEVEYSGKCGDLIGIFVGTGIGGGMVFGGNLFRGASSCAGEIGHMVLKTSGPICGCGNRGCFEALASRKAILKQIQERQSKGRKTILREIAGGDITQARSGDLRKAMLGGDKLVEEAVREASEHIGLAVASLVNLLNPAVFVLGGGVIQALADEMLPIIKETAESYSMRGTFRNVRITVSKLGDDAGITGAAALARRNAQLNQ